MATTKMFEDESENNEFVSYKKKSDTNLPNSVKQNKLVSFKSFKNKGNKRISTLDSSFIPNSTTKDVLQKSSKLDKSKNRPRTICKDNNKKLFSRKNNSNLNETGWIKTKNLSECSSQLMIDKEIITLDIENKVEILEPTGSNCCKRDISDMEVSNIEAANNKSQKPSTSFSKSFNEESETRLTNKLIVDNKVQKSSYFSKCLKKSDKSNIKMSKSKLNLFNSLKNVKSKKSDCIINIDDSDSITSDEDSKNVKNDQIAATITVNPNTVVTKINLSTKDLTNNKLAKENKPQNIISDSDLSSDDYIDISDSEVERRIEHKKKVQKLLASYQIKQQQQYEKTTNPLNCTSYKRRMIFKDYQNHNLPKKQKIVRSVPNTTPLDVFKIKTVYLD